MALETVRVRALDDTLSTSPVSGVVVRVYDETAETFITQATTGGDGWADFTLDGSAAPTPTIYQLRFYLVGGSTSSPKNIQVFSPAADAPSGTNDFGVTMHLSTAPEATDARLCRVSGRVVGPDGRARPGVDIAFIPQFSPVIAYPDTILGERVNTRSDASGSVLVDLFRGGIYIATVQSHDNVSRRVVVPDRPALLIADLLFPVIAAVTWDPAPPWTIAVGETLTITPTIVASNYQTLSGSAAEDATYTTEDCAIARAEVADVEKIHVTGVGVGTTNLVLGRRDPSIIRTPDSIVGSPATVHVV